MPDNQLPFHEYIKNTRHIVEERRRDLQPNHPDYQTILDANSPFELYPYTPPAKGNKYQYGALLIHGLYDSPFTVRDIGLQLQSKGILSRAVLLPGHGTQPDDLLHVSYQDWIDIVNYGVESLRNEVEKIFLIGYSTGATLAIHHALQDQTIARVIALSPAIKIKAPIRTVVAWQHMQRYFGSDGEWVCKEIEIDYAKYQSITFNSVFQLSSLAQNVLALSRQKKMHQPFLMILSDNDETISSRAALKFFAELTNPTNELIFYTNKKNSFAKLNTIIRDSYHQQTFIKHYSHVGIPFSPQNKHYGKNGDFLYASTENKLNCFYGAYNSIEQRLWDAIHRFGLTKIKRASLTYNPDFDFMMSRILNFIAQETMLK